jgi:hypothetical protein
LRPWVPMTMPLSTTETRTTPRCQTRISRI